MDLPTIRLGKRTLTVLFPTLLRPLTTSEHQALKNSIRKDGVHVAIVVDENDGIIDGINRATIAAELRIGGALYDVRKGLTHQQKHDLALTLNDARRHLTAADRKKVKEARKVRSTRKRHVEGKTLAVIAEEEGVSLSTAQRDVQATNEEAVLSSDKTADAPPPAPRVTGKDGKSYPAKKPRKAKDAEPAPIVSRPEPAPEAPSEAQEMLRHWWGLASDDDRRAFLAWAVV